MPKTRDQRCQRILHEFFREKTQNLHFILKKENVRGWKYARYEISIPNKWTFSIANYDHQTRSLIWTNQEKTQDISPIKDKIEETKDEFKTKFEPHEKKTPNNMNTLSFLRIYETELKTEEDMETVIYRLMVQYDKEHVPFSEDIDIDARLEFLEKRNLTLNNELLHIRNETERYVQHMRRRVNRALRERDDANHSVTQSGLHFMKQNAKYADSYRDIIRKCYDEMGKKFEECPVCYEEIKNKDIFITPCNHHICNNCTTKCKNSCPMCRQEMCYVPDEITV